MKSGKIDTQRGRHRLFRLAEVHDDPRPADSRSAGAEMRSGLAGGWHAAGLRG